MKRVPIAFLAAFLSWALVMNAGAEQKDMAQQLKALRAKIQAQYGANLPPLPVPVNNRQSPEKTRLGEALFFDPNLSRCGTIACASCHDPERGFSDGEQISDGCGGATGRRNSNTVYNTAYASHLFWDGRVQSLEEQALGPVVDPAEMSNTWDNVVAYLRTGTHPETKKEFPEAKDFYQRYFQRVFGGEISTTTVTKAIAAYERTVVSSGSPYDKWVKGDDRALTPGQKKGLLLFFGRANCAACHVPPNFTDFDFHNTGVPNAGFETPEKFPHNAEICGGIPKAVDPGRGEVAFLRSSCADLGKFKTPTLRNVESTIPYMHNGIFTTLEEVLSHYEELAKGAVKPGAGTLDPKVAKAAIVLGSDGGSPEDAKNLVQFLKALTGTQLKSPEGGVAPPAMKR
jgi:cytochrome c peroxidase